MVEKLNAQSTINDVVNCAVQASDLFEELGRTKRGFEIKKRYIQSNYALYKEVGRACKSAVASFTTGYPGYDLALKEIDEQYRYNHELLRQVQTLGLGNMVWKCGGCLIENYHKMPNLKQICYPCTATSAEIKPRKIINRLPDMDMWFVFDDSNLFQGNTIKKIENNVRLMGEISTELPKKNLYTSDINPLESINNMYEATKDLSKNKIPKINLPVDVHVVGLNYLKDLIENVPNYMFAKLNDNVSGDLKINPVSLRKSWEFDPEGYNFIYDFLASFTIIPMSKGNGRIKYNDIESDLISLVNQTRQKVVEIFDEEEIMKVLMAVSGPASIRRLKTPSVTEEFYKKLANWKKGNYEKGNWILENSGTFGSGKSW